MNVWQEPQGGLRLLFAMFDQDRDGFLSRDEASAWGLAAKVGTYPSVLYTALCTVLYCTVLYCTVLYLPPLFGQPQSSPSMYYVPVPYAAADACM